MVFFYRYWAVTGPRGRVRWSDRGANRPQTTPGHDRQEAALCLGAGGGAQQEAERALVCSKAPGQRGAAAHQLHQGDGGVEAGPPRRGWARDLAPF